MSQQQRLVPTDQTICDLCDEPIPEGEPGERGSLTWGWIGYKVELPRTRRVWFRWPPAGRERTQTFEERMADEVNHGTWDFHADCIFATIKDDVKRRKERRDD